MDRYFIENEKYIIRPIETEDKEQVANLIRENKYMNRLWHLENMGDVFDSVIQSVYMESDSSYCIVSKETGDFCGYMEISPGKETNEEGELAIRLTDKVDMCEFMNILGDVFKEIGHGSEKNITLQYTFD